MPAIAETTRVSGSCCNTRHVPVSPLYETIFMHALGRQKAMSHLEHGAHLNLPGLVIQACFPHDQHDFSMPYVPVCSLLELVALYLLCAVEKQSKVVAGSGLNSHRPVKNET